MAQVKYVRPEKISLRSHPELNERWVQDRIAEDPSLLGLGDLILKDKERMHAQAGRLDLLLQDPETKHRYELELQLGPTDPSHIIRTIEYWDIERKRYPQYDHTAVIVAEDVTSRFLNVISLFNGFIPLMAIQLQALKFDDHISLVFTTVLDQTPLGLVDEDEEVQEPTDRAYWEKKGTKAALAMVDEVLEILRGIDSGLTLTYTKYYIGLAKNGRPNNFVTFRTQKDSTRMEVRLPRSDETQARIDEAGLETLPYDARYGNYRIRLAKGDINKHQELLKDILETAYLTAMG